MTTSMCAHQFRYFGENCKEEVYGTSSYCILHIELPYENSINGGKL